MKNNLPYCKTSLAIKGYEDSSIAKSEKNDCVVRAIASSFDIDYDSSHFFVKKMFYRKHRQGTKNFVSKMYSLIEKGIDIGGKKFEAVGKIKHDFTKRHTLKYEVKVNGSVVERKMTVGTFTKKNPKGTYLVVVRGHAFTIKNGVVIGNIEDSERRKKIINYAWKVIN
jgi:hypothetical protein